MKRMFKICNLAALTTASVLYLVATTDVAAQGRQSCGPREIVVKRLAEGYGETRQAMGLAASNAVIEVYASAETGSWTITVTRANGVTCLVASGEQFETLTEILPANDEDA